MTIITHEQLIIANENWCSYFSTSINTLAPIMDRSFLEFIDFHPREMEWAPDNGIQDRLSMPDHAARRVLLLTSPHWQTLLKAYLIQNTSVGVPK